MKTLQLSIIGILFVAVSLSINVVFAQLSNSQNLMMVVKTGNSQGANFQNGTYSQTVEFGGNVGILQTGQPVNIKIFKNGILYKTDIITAGNFYSDKLFWYQITVTGKSGLDSYKIDFTYGNQTVEEGLPVIPPPPPMVSNDCNVKSKRMLLLPLQQLTMCGSPADGIICNTGFQLILKAEDGSPACVFPTAAQKLVERGWRTNEIFSSSVSSATTNKPVFVVVKRVDNQLNKDGTINIVDSQMIAKYQGLHEAIIMADKQYFEFERILATCHCANTTHVIAGLDAPPPQFKITVDLANQMVNDPAFKFSDDSPPDKRWKLYGTGISYENGTYLISISMI
jgi:hypothetical protein